MAKRVDLSLTIHLPTDHEADKVSVYPDGRVRVFDKKGNEVVPPKVERASHYERPKGRKYQSRTTVTEGYASVGGLEELARLDSFIVIDTNSVEIDGTKVSAAFFIACKLIAQEESFRLASLDGRGHVYEFHNVPGNAEMLAILKIAHDTIRGQKAPTKGAVGFVTDSEMGTHEAISSRKQPIYADHRLPEGFALVYASAETGQELPNKLIRFCDSQSRRYLERLKKGAFRRTGLAPLEQDSSVVFRYTYYPTLKISDSIVSGTSIASGTKYSVEFSGNAET